MSQPPRANYCGNFTPDHRAYRCQPCQTIRQRELRKRKRAGIVRIGPSCALCGIAQGNTYGIKVYRYSLLRNVRSSKTRTGWTNKSVASLPVCDRCLIEGGYAREALMPPHLRRTA